MSSLWNRHPESRLVPYLDGELTPRQTRRVEQHLETCGQCRQELEALRSAVADCRLYRQEVRLPEPPLPWNSLYRDFSRIDESLANEPLLVRLARPLVHAGALRVAMAAAMAMLVVTGVFYQLRHAPTVQAASLLKRAVAVAEAKPRPVHRIHFRTGKKDFTRSVGPQAPLSEAAAAPDIKALFELAHYDWNDPLTARAFMQWRDTVAEKTDQVSTITQPSGDGYQIHTVAAQGEIADATLTLGADLSPTEERLEFRDGEWVELTEISESFSENGGMTVARKEEVPVRAAETPSRPAAFTPRSEASISDELQVVYALHQIGADLGDPIEVSLSNGKVLVTSAGLSPERQRKVQTALQNLPIAELQFNAPQPAVAAPEASAPVEAAGAGPAIQSRVEKQVGGRAQFERFSSQVLELDDAAMARVYALRTLAQKFPVDSESQLSVKDRELQFGIHRELL